MLEVILFDDGEYGIRNQWSGQILSENGRVLSYRSPKKAERKARKIAKKFNRVIAGLEKNHR